MYTTIHPRGGREGGKCGYTWGCSGSLAFIPFPRGAEATFPSGAGSGGGLGVLGAGTRTCSGPAGCGGCCGGFSTGGLLSAAGRARAGSDGAAASRFGLFGGRLRNSGSVYDACVCVNVCMFDCVYYVCLLARVHS